jgi:type II restriction enzyme
MRNDKRQTRFQLLGELGELTVIQTCGCPRCKQVRTLRRLRANFKAADIICDFCGFTAQAKAVTVTKRNQQLKSLLGAAWSVQNERMKSHIYLPLFIVTVYKGQPERVLYVPSDLQGPKMFKPRKPLSATARRAGWQGFVYDLSVLPPGIPVLLWEPPKHR